MRRVSTITPEQVEGFWPNLVLIFYITVSTVSCDTVLLPMFTPALTVNTSVHNIAWCCCFSCCRQIVARYGAKLMLKRHTSTPTSRWTISSKKLRYAYTCMPVIIYFRQIVSVQLLFSSHLLISVTVQLHRKFYSYFEFKFLTNFTSTSSSSVQICFNFKFHFCFWMFDYNIIGLSYVFVQFQKNSQLLK